VPLLIVILILLLLFGSRLLPKLGEDLGRKARKPYRQARWLWNWAAGTEEDAIRAEREYGLECSREFAGQFPGNTDPGDQEFVDSVGSKLAEAVEDRRIKFRFAAVASSTANAYALPGGFVFITRALLKLTGYDRDAAAFFLGHEIAHITKGHARDRLTASTLLHAVSARLSGTGQLMRELLDKGYSRALEQEADLEAVRLAKAAGFDSRASIRALEKLGSVAKDHSGLAEYFSTHPSFTERIRDLEAVV
jgi:predicted Zn-dependent protease